MEDVSRQRVLLSLRRNHVQNYSLSEETSSRFMSLGAHHGPAHGRRLGCGSKGGYYKSGCCCWCSCRACTPGKRGAYSNQNDKSCYSCTTGQYQNQNWQTSCKNCGKGTYQNQNGQSGCKNCPRGTFLFLSCLLLSFFLVGREKEKEKERKIKGLMDLLRLDYYLSHQLTFWLYISTLNFSLILLFSLFFSLLFKRSIPRSKCENKL